VPLCSIRFTADASPYNLFAGGELKSYGPLLFLLFFKVLLLNLQKFSSHLQEGLLKLFIVPLELQIFGLVRLACIVTLLLLSFA
jgi:hypothetical protein